MDFIIRYHKCEIEELIYNELPAKILDGLPQHLLDRYFSIHEKFTDKSPLHSLVDGAISERAPNLAKYLINRGDCYISGYTLNVAAIEGYKDLMELILSKDIPVPKHLIYSVLNNSREINPDIIQWLINNGAIVDNMALILAIRKKLYKIVEILIEQITDLNSHILTEAINTGDEELVRMLINRDISINKKHIIKSVQLDYYEITKLLIERMI